MLTGNNGFAVGTLPATLGPEASATLVVSLTNTSKAGAFTATVGIPTDDPAVPAGIFNFSVKATIAPAPGSDQRPPTATLTVAPRVTAAGKYYRFTVLYADPGGVDVTTLDKSDVSVAGPPGALTGAKLISATPSAAGTIVDAVYRFNALGGSWDSGDNGVYTVSVRKNQVKDLHGNTIVAAPTVSAADGGDGRFRVKVPAVAALAFTRAAGVAAWSPFAVRATADDDDDAFWA